jgi:hypothetical protein
MANDAFEGMAQFLAGRANKMKLTQQGVKAGADIFTEALKKNTPYNPEDHSKYGHARDQIEAVESSGGGYDTTWGDAFWYLFIDKGAVPGKKGSHAVPAQNITRKTWAQTQKKVFEAMEKPIK